MSLKDTYIPDIDLLSKFFDTRKAHLNFPFAVPELKYSPEKFEEVIKFCEKWDLETSQASNLYWVTDQIIPGPVLDAFQKIGAENIGIIKVLKDLKQLDSAELSELKIKLLVKGKSKTIILKDSFYLDEIRCLLSNYFNSTEKPEKYNFKSEAYEHLAIGLERYFEHEEIEQNNSTRRHEMIGRLLLLAKLPVRTNNSSLAVTKYERLKRKDINEVDDFDDLQLSQTIRNWIIKSQKSL